MRDSWQERVYARLLPGTWVSLSDLFSAVANDIPVHRGLRRIASTTSRDPGTVSIVEARWCYFTSIVRGFEIVTDQTSKKRSMIPGAMIRLKPITSCPHCTASMYRTASATWSRITCSCCALEIPNPFWKKRRREVEVPEPSNVIDFPRAANF